MPLATRLITWRFALGFFFLVISLTTGVFAGEARGQRKVYKTIDGKQLEIEIFFPAAHVPTQHKAAAVLLFHGGGWSSGDLSQFRGPCEYFARRGLVAATASYRMHPKEELKEPGRTGERKRICITDAISAIRWYKQQAAVLGIDPKRIVVGGGSAGGHLAMLATLHHELDDPSDPKGVDTSVLAYLLFNPAFTAAGRDQDDAVDVFAHLKPGIPPSLFMFGEKDGWMSASELLVAELRKRGARAEWCIADGVGHNFWRARPWSDRCLIECDRFLVSLGILSGEPLLSEPSGIDFNRIKSTK